MISLRKMCQLILTISVLHNSPPLYPKSKSLSGLNHFNDFFLGLVFVVVANKLTFIVINNAFFLISKEAFFKLVHAIPSRKLRKGTNTGFIEHTSSVWKIRTFPTAVQSFFFTTVIVLAPVVAFTASVLATNTTLILGTYATRKSAKCDSFHYNAASHSSVNSRIDCCRLMRSSLTALAAISKSLSLSCHFSRVRLYSPKRAKAVAPRV